MDRILARIRELRRRLDIIESGGTLNQSPRREAGAARKAEAVQRRKLTRLFNAWKKRLELVRVKKPDTKKKDLTISSSSSDDEIQESPYLAIQAKLKQQLERLKNVKTLQPSSSSSSSSSIEAFIAKQQTATKARTPTQSPQTQSEIKISLSSGSEQLNQSSIRKSGEKKKGSPVTFVTSDDSTSDTPFSPVISESSRPVPSQSLSAILKMASFSDSD